MSPWLPLPARGGGREDEYGSIPDQALRSQRGTPQSHLGLRPVWQESSERRDYLSFLGPRESSLIRGKCRSARQASCRGPVLMIASGGVSQRAFVPTRSALEACEKTAGLVAPSCVKASASPELGSDGDRWLRLAARPRLWSNGMDDHVGQSIDGILFVVHDDPLKPFSA